MELQPSMLTHEANRSEQHERNSPLKARRFIVIEIVIKKKKRKEANKQWTQDVEVAKKPKHQLLGNYKATINNAIRDSIPQQLENHRPPE